MTFPGGWAWNGLALAAISMLAACSRVPIPPTYTPAELRAQCERQGGWWHPDSLPGGFCEYDSQL